MPIGSKQNNSESGGSVVSPEEFMKELWENFNLEYHKKCLLETIKNHNDTFTYV